MNEEQVLAAVRKYIVARRQEIADKFPKKLTHEEYLRHCGRHEELESIAAVVQDAIRKANEASSGDPDDDPDTT